MKIINENIEFKMLIKILKGNFNENFKLQILNKYY